MVIQCIDLAQQCSPQLHHRHVRHEFVTVASQVDTCAHTAGQTWTTRAYPTALDHTPRTPFPQPTEQLVLEPVQSGVWCGLGHQHTLTETLEAVVEHEA